MKPSLLLSFALMAALATCALAKEKGEHKRAADAVKAKCPVSGEDISKDAAIDYKGGKLYFCCSGCAEKFEKDKAKYETKANQQLVITGQAKQIGCPLSGGKLNPATKIKVCGAEVAFCCKNCQGKIAKAKPEEQCEMVFGKNFDKAFKVGKQDKEEK